MLKTFLRVIGRSIRVLIAYLLWVIVLTPFLPFIILFWVIEQVALILEKTVTYWVDSILENTAAFIRKHILK